MDDAEGCLVRVTRAMSGVTPRTVARWSGQLCIRQRTRRGTSDDLGHGQPSAAFVCTLPSTEYAGQLLATASGSTLRAAGQSDGVSQGWRRQDNRVISREVRAIGWRRHTHAPRARTCSRVRGSFPGERSYRERHGIRSTRVGHLIIDPAGQHGYVGRPGQAAGIDLLQQVPHPRQL